MNVSVLSLHINKEIRLLRQNKGSKRKVYWIDRTGLIINGLALVQQPVLD